MVKIKKLNVKIGEGIVEELNYYLTEKPLIPRDINPINNIINWLNK